MMNDLKFAIRQLGRNPGFAAVAVLTLGLAIGATTTSFCALYRVVLQPLPFPQSDRLVTVSVQTQNADLATRELSFQEFETLEHSGRIFAGLGAFSEEVRNLSGAGVPLRAWGARVSPGFFSAFNLSPTVGRLFAEEEFFDGANQVVILTDALWRDRLGGRPDVVGERILLDGKPMTVCGVMPREFRFPSRLTAYWTPLVPSMEEVQEADTYFLQAVARSAPGVTLPQVNARLRVLSQGLPANRAAATNDHVSLVGTSLLTERLGASRRELWLIFAAVMCALSIGAINLAHQFLTRVSIRRREFAVRIALGADRGRILRQWLSESCLISLLGGAIGVLLATWWVSLLRNHAPYGLPRADEIVIGPAVVAFGFAAALLVGMGTSAFPLVRSLVQHRSDSTALQGRDDLGGGRRFWLVTAQSAVATLLLIGAGLLWRSYQGVIAVDPGFSREDLLTARLVLSQERYDDEETLRNFYRQLTERIASLPEIAGAGLVNALPLSDIDFLRPLTIENQAASADPMDKGTIRGNFVSVSVNYFRLLGIPLTAGRSFERADETGAPVAVVSESLAKRYFQDGNAVGRRIRIGPGNWRPWMTVVGVVADVRSGGRDTPSTPTFYVPYLQSELPTYTLRGMFLVAKTRANSDAVVSRLRGALNEQDPDLALANIDTMNGRLRESVGERRFRSTLMGAFAILAAVLAMSGVFSVLSCVVANRRHELGVRMALGSSRAGLFQLVLGQGLRPVLAGIGLGWVLALLARGALAGLLYGISPNDPVTFLMVGMLFTVIATMGCLVPACRAAGMDPMKALRGS